MIRSRSNAGFAICNPEGRKKRRISRGHLFVLAALILFPALAHAADPSWRMLIEPKFMKHEVSYAIPGSERAVLAPALVKDGEPVCLSEKEFKTLDVDRKAFLAAAEENAAVELKKLTPEFKRNRKKVIQYATIISENPLTASVVLAPGFLKLFADTLGPKVIVAIPNRYTIYVFPALASHYQDYAPMISEAYRATSYPVSMEAYELSEQGLKAVGLYPEP